jgi:hypothetical protein
VPTDGINSFERVPVMVLVLESHHGHLWREQTCC